VSVQYDLIGGPCDGEALMLEDEALRVSIPYACEDGCCAWGETYDWDEKSDKTYALWYVGRLDIEDINSEDEDCMYDTTMGQFVTCPDGRDEQIADLEAMFLEGDEEYYD
jgi:hypothetical protein